MTGDNLIVVLLDWEKAFDKVDQKKMLDDVVDMMPDNQFKTFKEFNECEKIGIDAGRIQEYNFNSKRGIFSISQLSPSLLFFSSSISHFRFLLST